MVDSREPGLYPSGQFKKLEKRVFRNSQEGILSGARDFLLRRYLKLNLLIES